jgi:ankyrin repeat protein
MAPDKKVEARAKKVIVAVSKKEYLKVMQQIHEGGSPNDSWKGMLPIRTAVLVGDIDMVALLMSLGANPLQEPKGTVTADDGTETEIVLGKCARVLASEMASDMSNPLNQEGVTMLQVLDEPEEAKRRVIALQGRLEAQIAADLKSTSRSTIFFFIALVVSYLMLRQTWTDDSDTKEL